MRRIPSHLRRVLRHLQCRGGLLRITGWPWTDNERMTPHPFEEPRGLQSHEARDANPLVFFPPNRAHHNQVRVMDFMALSECISIPGE